MQKGSNPTGHSGYKFDELANPMCRQLKIITLKLHIYIDFSAENLSCLESITIK